MQAAIFGRELVALGRVPYATRMTILAENIMILVDEQGGQVPLAEKIGASQPAISRLIAGSLPRNLGALEAAAKLAGVTVEQLRNVPLQEARAQAVPVQGGQRLMMPVMLPSEAILSNMFAGMLDIVMPEVADEIAPRLAQLLPGALARAQGPEPLLRTASEAKGPAESPPPPAKGRPSRRQSPHT